MGLFQIISVDQQMKKMDFYSTILDLEKYFLFYVITKNPSCLLLESKNEDISCFEGKV